MSEPTSQIIEMDGEHMVVNESIVRNILLAWGEYWQIKDSKKGKSIWACLYVDGV